MVDDPRRDGRSRRVPRDSAGRPQRAGQRRRTPSPWDNTPYGWSTPPQPPQERPTRAGARPTARNPRPLEPPRPHEDRPGRRAASRDTLWDMDPVREQHTTPRHPRTRPLPAYEAARRPSSRREDSDRPVGAKPANIPAPREAENTTSKKAKRPPRFDFLTAVGELLMTAGAIVALFAFWQVYVTDWQVAAATDQQLEQFQEEIKPAPQRIATDERTDDPPPFAPVGYGQVLGALHIPEWNHMIVPVREGTGNDVLDTGAAGHYKDTAQPGAVGNFAVAAHRRSYGSNFRRIDTLKEGSFVVMETKDAWLVYRFSSKKIVDPHESDVILPVPDQPDAQPTQRLLTMTTCHPEYGNSERYIVHLELDHWVPHDAGIPKEIAEGR